MAVLVEHKDSGKCYVLVGTGFGAFKALRPHKFLGNLSQYEEEGEIALVSVCNRKGEIVWFYSDDLRVVNIDGETPGKLLR